MKSLVMASTALCLCAGAAYAWSPVDKTQFTLVPNAAFLKCLSADGTTPPVAKVVVTRENLNDTLSIHVTGLKPKLQFDLFTVERSPFLADGLKDPNFPGTFGLAWYQSDLDADDDGTADIQVKKPLRSIFLDQIFGFDGDKKSDGTIILPPVNTYHVGFWFNNPEDAKSCEFDVTKPTPFNGEHRAGPLAMISIPVEATNLGPLCVSPEEGTPCHPPEWFEWLVATSIETVFVVEGARDGPSVADLMRTGAKVLDRDQVMPGIAEMIHDVQVEVTFPDGTKLVTVHEPIRWTRTGR